MNDKRFIRNIVGQIYDMENDKFYEEDYEGKPIDYEDDVIKLLNEQDATIERYQFIIKDALSRERTQLGQSVLRQLAEALEIEI